MENKDRVLGMDVMRRYLANLTDEATVEKVKNGLERFKIKCDSGINIVAWDLVDDNMIGSAVHASAGRMKEMYFLGNSNHDGEVKNWSNGSAFRVSNFSALRRPRHFFNAYNDFVADTRAKIVREISEIRFGIALVPEMGYHSDKLTEIIKASCPDIKEDIEVEVVDLNRSAGLVFDVRKAAYVHGADMGVALYERDLYRLGQLALEDSVALVRKKVKNLGEMTT